MASVPWPRGPPAGFFAFAGVCVLLGVILLGLLPGDDTDLISQVFAGLFFGLAALALGLGAFAYAARSRSVREAEANAEPVR